MAFLHRWQNRAFWRKQLRVAVLQRDPICRRCFRAASTHADHIKPFCDDKGNESWELFCSMENLQGLCAECHSEKTGKYDSGFGHAAKTYDPLAAVRTGDAGRQFQASTVGSEALDRALGTPEEQKELLENIPS